jgi:hypothetical protein
MNHWTEQRKDAMRDKVNEAVETARPYVERIARDEELHEHVKRAYGSARRLYDDLIGPTTATGVARRVATDEDIRAELSDVMDELKQASRRARGEESHAARNVTLILIGVALGALFNPITGPETRRWLKEALLGPDEPFEFEPAPKDSSEG